jgi:hypothetical protein
MTTTTTTIDETKQGRRILGAVTLLLGAAVLQPVAAQESGGLTVDVDECVVLEKPDERLACFEAQVEAARRGAAGPRVSEPAESSKAAPVESPRSERERGSGEGIARSDDVPRSDGGKSGSDEDKSGADREMARSDEDDGRAELGSEPEQTEITAKVTELRETVPNAYLITLDNGQVWRQSQPMRYPLRTGLDVRLRPTKWGYRLSAPELHGQIRVERVR